MKLEPVLLCLASLQGALAILLVASQLVAFIQLSEAHGGTKPAPGAGTRPAGKAAEATIIAAAPKRKISSSGSSSHTNAAEATSGGNGRSNKSNDNNNENSNMKAKNNIQIKNNIRASISLSSTKKGYESGVWIKI